MYAKSTIRWINNRPCGLFETLKCIYTNLQSKHFDGRRMSWHMLKKGERIELGLEKKIRRLLGQRATE